MLPCKVSYACADEAVFIAHLLNDRTTVLQSMSGYNNVTASTIKRTKSIQTLCTKAASSFSTIITIDVQTVGLYIVFSSLIKCVTVSGWYIKWFECLSFGSQPKNLCRLNQYYSNVHNEPQKNETKSDDDEDDDEEEEEETETKTNPSESTLQFAYLILYGYCVPLMYYIARIKFRIIDTFTRFNGCE